MPRILGFDGERVKAGSIFFRAEVTIIMSPCLFALSVKLKIYNRCGHKRLFITKFLEGSDTDQNSIRDFEITMSSY